MEVRVLGSGGPRGWPEPGCRCASCQRARSAGPGRAPFGVLVDGVLRLEGPHPEWPEGAGRDLDGYLVARLTGGWDVTAPDGGRLLCADGLGTAPAVPPGTPRYDVALLDLLADPAQFGWLRRQGAVAAGTVAAVAFADHRVVSERELRRRGHIWRAAVPRDGDIFRGPAPVAVPGAERGAVVTRGPGVTADPEALAAGGRPVPYRVLVLGGARSGKSAEAEMRVAAEPAVTYVATAPPALPGEDAEWAARIAAHRARRPSWWHTLETSDLPGALRQARGTILVDSITAWLAAVMDECGAWDGATGPDSRLGQRIAELIGVWRQVSAYVVAVSDETGLGIVPGTPAGRLFRDELGRLNQALAAESEELAVVVAGQLMTAGGADFSCE
jgi:adenosylcobinamide kinase / adenosylcobinamide-phosphate guanylyltransferase